MQVLFYFFHRDELLAFNIGINVCWIHPIQNYQS